MKAWQMLRRFLAKCYLPNDEYSHIKRSELQLVTPLGTWLPNDKHHIQYKYYIIPTSLSVYQCTHSFFCTHRPHSTHRTTIDYTSIGKTTYLPTIAHPILTTTTPCNHLCILKNHIDKQSTSRNTHTPILQHITNSFINHIQSLPLWEKELLRHHTLQLPTNKISGYIMQHFIITTGGSEQDQKGSYAWVLSTESGTVFATRHGTASGHQISSFRCGAYGILAALHFIIQLRRFYQLPQPRNHVTWWCDCISLLT